MYQTLRKLLLPVFVCLAASAQANDLAQPEGEIILTISGAISNSNSDMGAEFDLAMLDALEQRETVTETPWHDGAQRFSGPVLNDLLALVGAEGQTLRIVALNDYAAEMPISDAAEIPVILASRREDMLMPVRDKGPLFVIYPFSEMPELNNEVYFSRSVWQIKAIEVHP